LQTEILYGIHPVYEALLADRRRIFELYIQADKKSKRLEQIAILAESRHVSIQYMDVARIKAMAGSSQNQGVAAKASTYPFVTIEKILAKADPDNGRPFLLLLDNIVDPHNLGALIRTAVCVGVHGIVIPKDRSAAPTPAVSKISAGGLEHIYVSRQTNMVQTIKEFKKKGIWIFGMEKKAADSVFTCDLTGPAALIIGSEKSGVRPLVKKNCDFLISIPQLGPIESLNASVAGAVVMYEVLRQRQYIAGKC
jgi:23S rRNA (guanosine2251-2'-O)-methyltransferase